MQVVTIATTLLSHCGDILTTLTPSVIGNNCVAELTALGMVTVQVFEPISEMDNPQRHPNGKHPHGLSFTGQTSVGRTLRPAKIWSKPQERSWVCDESKPASLKIHVP